MGETWKINHARNKRNIGFWARDSRKYGSVTADRCKIVITERNTARIKMVEKDNRRALVIKLWKVKYMIRSEKRQREIKDYRSKL